MLPVNLLIMQHLEDEERRRRRNNFNRERVTRRLTYDPFDLEDELFVKLYRLKKPLVRNLIDSLVPFHHNNGRRDVNLSLETKIFTALSFYATGSYQTLVGQSFNISVSQQSVSNCIKEVTGLIVDNLSDEWIQFPVTNEAKTSIKLKFHQAYGFPGVIGAIDCTHIKILAPRIEEHNYLNRKGYHSKNVQIICDPQLRILAFNPRYGGATHDAFIWRNSIIRDELHDRYHEGDHSTWLLGDSGYPLEPWLLTPIVGAAPNTPEGRFTQAHMTLRNCIERCNGVLKARFRCLNNERGLRYDPNTVGNIATACAILHNMCVNDNDLYVGEEMDFEEGNANIDGFNQPPVQGPLLNEARRIRTALINRYFNN